MKRIVVAAMLCLSAAVANAADRRIELPLAELLASDEAKNAGIDGSVKFFLAGAKTPKIVSRLGEDVSNKKTNSVGKSPEEACRRVMLSVLIAFQNSAKARGANAVVDFTSYYQKNEFKSATAFECHDGNVTTGVAMKGTYAKIK